MFTIEVELNNETVISFRFKYEDQAYAFLCACGPAAAKTDR